MIEIIPAILTDREEEFIRLVRAFEAAGVTRVHLDVCDGVFVPTKTITGYQELARMTTTLKFDIHLMVADAAAHCEPWRGSPHADRFLVHVEAVADFGALAEHAHICGKQLGASINPETPMEKLEAVTSYTDLAQFMTVHPGKQGNPFVPEVLERIKLFAANHPGMTIMADGGITPDTAARCVAAGASVLACGSYITRSSDINAAIQAVRASVVK